MNISRRSILKALGMTPAALPTFKALEAHAGLNALGLTGTSYDPVKSVATTAMRSRDFVDFTSWWGEFGAEAAKRRASYVNGFDADVLALRLPLVTKVRMQQARNLQRERENAFCRFMSVLKRDGAYREWL